MKIKLGTKRNTERDRKEQEGIRRDKEDQRSSRGKK